MPTEYVRSLTYRINFLGGRARGESAGEPAGAGREAGPRPGQGPTRANQGTSSRRSFGLNFEQHVPETVELYGRKIRRGDKVRFLAPRGSTEPESVDVETRRWRVIRIQDVDGVPTASLIDIDGDEETTRAVEDLVVVADFRDPIYPGLRSTGKVERGGDKPFHTVINAENYHALQALMFAYEGKVDAIYIDPPYNSGARDWTYNNDYVDGEDAYRHSKWLAFMERRLKGLAHFSILGGRCSLPRSTRTRPVGSAYCSNRRSLPARFRWSRSSSTQPAHRSSTSSHEWTNICTSCTSVPRDPYEP